MFDDDAIRVSISASKEVETTADGRRDKFTMYTVFARNATTARKVVVKRRYSDFYRLRKELIDQLAWGHCPSCARYAELVSQYHFPRRRLLRSSQAAVVKERIDSLALFLRHLLQCLGQRLFDDCDHARESVETCVLQSFLEIQYDALFARSTNKAHVLQALEDKRQEQQVKAAGLLLAKKPQGHTRNPALAPPPVDADTCRRCRQKWTNCYCNNDEDDLGGVDGGGHGGLYNLHHPSDYPEVGDVSAQGHRGSNVSDASNCSRCDQDWDHCFCCQQVSPTASSAYTDN